MQVNFTKEKNKHTFIQELANQVPNLPPALQQTIADLFASYSHDLDHFSFAVNALQAGYNHLTPHITQIAAHILNGKECTAKKREGEPLEEPKAKRQHLETAEEKAHSFLQKLLKNADQLDDLDEHANSLLALLSSPSTFRAAWQCLAGLCKLKRWKSFFCTAEKLHVLLSILEETTKTQLAPIRVRYACLPLSNTATSFANRLINLTYSLQASPDAQPITNALCVFTRLLINHLQASKVQYELKHQEAEALLMLMHNPHLALASIAIQNVFLWNISFDTALETFSIQKLCDISMGLLDGCEDTCIVTSYLSKLCNHFDDSQTAKPILDHLKATLFSLAENASPPVAYACCAFISGMDLSRFCRVFGEKGAERMLDILKRYSSYYKMALKQNQALEIENLQKIVLQASVCLCKMSSLLSAASIQTLCDAFVDQLHSSDNRLVISATCKLASLSFESKETYQNVPVNLGLQCIPIIYQLLKSENPQIISSALWSLKVFAWSAPNQALLLSTDVLERVKELILTSDDAFMANALSLGSECLKLRTRIEEADANFVEHLFSLAINGPYQSHAIRALYNIVPVKNFPLQSGKETLEKILAMRKKADPLLTEAIYLYLSNLAKVGLANKLYQLGILEDIALLWNAEAFSEKVVVGFCFCFCEIAEPILKEAIAETSLGQASAFSATARIDAVLCLLSPAFNSKYVKCQETACWLTHKIATIPGADLQKISHCAFAKGVALLASPNESVAQGAMWLAGKLLPISINFSKMLFEEMIDKLLGWLEKGQPKSQQLALRVLGTMSSNHAAICPAMIDKGVLAKVLPLLSEPALTELAIWLAGCLTAHARPAIKQHFTEEKILRYLSSESPMIKEGMVFILAAMGPLPVSENGQKTIANLLWPLTADKTAGRHIFKALAHVHPKENLLSLLQSKEPISKNTFLIFLNILSQYNITTPPYISPLANEPSPYAALYQSHAHLSDIALHIEGAGALHCHKVVLAAHSGYFKACFLSGMLENQQSVISIKDVNQDAFKKCIQFIYEQQYTFTTIADAKDMLQMAQRFQVPNLEAACIQFLVSQLTPNAAEEICQIASHSMELQIQVMQWMMHSYCRLTEKLQQQIEDDEMWLEFYKVLINAKD